MAGTPAILAAGVIFGVGITASGVYLPHIIQQQMAVQEFHMMKVFLTGSAISALIFAIVSKTGSRLNPRAARNLGRLGEYDGNIIGGAMIGIGMTLSGACPGTIFAQLGTGLPSSLPALLGGLLGGIAYVGTAPYIKRSSLAVCSPSGNPTGPPLLTIPAKFKLNPDAVLVGFEAVLITVIFAASQLQGTPSNLLPPVFGGILIGIAQACSLLLIGSPLGTSGSFEEFGQWFWRLVDMASGKPVKKDSPSTESMKFVTAIGIGAFLLTSWYPVFQSPSPFTPSSIRAALGGLIMIFGSRVAGGCTSGHGISGMSMLSLASFISVAAMFGGGMSLGVALRYLGY